MISAGTSEARMHLKVMATRFFWLEHVAHKLRSFFLLIFKAMFACLETFGYIAAHTPLNQIQPCFLVKTTPYSCALTPT
jgi:hypothetical protein